MILLNHKKVTVGNKVMYGYSKKKICNVLAVVCKQPLNLFSKLLSYGVMKANSGPNKETITAETYTISLSHIISC